MIINKLSQVKVINELYHQPLLSPSNHPPTAAMANSTPNDGIASSSDATTFASRNPGRAVQEARGHKKTEPLSDSQKQERKDREARARMRAEDLQADIDAYYAQRDDTISSFKASREPSLYRAVMHHLKAEGNIATMRSTRNMDAATVKNHKRAAILIELHRLTKEALNEGFTPEEEKEMIAALRAAREHKRVGVQASNIAAATDTRNIANRIQDELVALFERTGTRGFCLMTRGHCDDGVIPTFLHSGESKAFVIEVLKRAPLDVLRLFEQWSCARSAVRRDNRSSLCMQIAQLVEEKLREITGSDTLRIDYVNMDVAIREAWKHVEPLHPLRDGWVSGRISWVAMTPEQVAELADELAARRAANSGVVKKRKQRSDKNGKHTKTGARAVGKPRKTKAGKGKGKEVAKTTSKRKAGKGCGDEEEEEEEEESDEESEDESDDKSPVRRQPIPHTSVHASTSSRAAAEDSDSDDALVDLDTLPCAPTTSTSATATLAPPNPSSTSAPLTSTFTSAAAQPTSTDTVFIQYVPPGTLGDTTNKKCKAPEAEDTPAAKRRKTAAAPKPKPAPKAKPTPAKAPVARQLPDSGYKVPKKVAAPKAPRMDPTTEAALRALVERTAARASAAMVAQVPPHA
ncbi:hypothetical protein DFH09DRAFT_1342205 [Mycena vulgaris]|nr:hypothetical protein DFH09DRAFT_1342205 [Mycena vulgaris]